MDFELPDEWMENPDLFLFKPYDEKLAMIRGLMTPITVEMVIQEINRYADSEFRYADKSDEVAIEGDGAGLSAGRKRRSGGIWREEVNEALTLTLWNSILPLAGLCALVAWLPGWLAGRGNLSQARLSRAVGVTAVGGAGRGGRAGGRALCGDQRGGLGGGPGGSAGAGGVLPGPLGAVRAAVGAGAGVRLAGEGAGAEPAVGDADGGW